MGNVGRQLIIVCFQNHLDSSMSIQKIVLKGTGKISLHERFTQLKFEGTHSDWEGGSAGVGAVRGGGVGRHGQGASRSYPRDPSPQYNYLQRKQSRPTSVLYSPREKSEERSLRNGLERKPQFGPSATIVAAARLKKRSIQQRLGVRARLSLPRFRMGMGGGASWGSTGSLNSTGSGTYRWEEL